MPKNLTQKLIASHILSGEMKTKEEIALRVDQTLTQDATGTMVMLELEAMGCDKVATEISAQYVDHNLLETDFKNPDDHIFLQSACEKFGIYYSRAGNGVSHPVHMERFGIPGKTLIGSDSHTCAAGSLGMLAIGTGGLEVALAMMGEPLYLQMPLVFGIHLTGKLPQWVSAKDVILEILRRHGVKGGVGRIIEYHGPGLKDLSAMDRHVIANMGAELGATTSIFPADEAVKSFLRQQDREADFVELLADQGCTYDEEDHIDLAKLEPMIAKPKSPGDVVLVKEVAGKPIYQAMIGSSANPGLRDFAVPALMLKNNKIHPDVSFDVNPTSRQILQNLTKHQYLSSLIAAGGRIHQAGCNGCIGMGQAPATKRISLRTVPRNFPGRSGTKDDLVYLCSPETATASAIEGKITDPKTMKMSYPIFEEPKHAIVNKNAIIAPPKDQTKRELIMGPNIKPLPRFGEIEDAFEGPVLLKMGDNISTDEILPAGANVLPFRSNIPEISKFAFAEIDNSFYERAQAQNKSASFIVGGENYGQGSSREHAAIAPRYLGVKAVIAKTYARIHRDNLINFGIIPFTFVDKKDWEQICQGETLEAIGLWAWLKKAGAYELKQSNGKTLRVLSALTEREREIIRKGSLINLMLKRN